MHLFRDTPGVVVTNPLVTGSDVRHLLFLVPALLASSLDQLTDLDELKSIGVKATCIVLVLRCFAFSCWDTGCKVNGKLS